MNDAAARTPTRKPTAPARRPPEQPRADDKGQQQGIFAGYKGQDAPLGGYAVLMGLYGAAFAGFLLARRRSGRPLPERPALADIVLLGVATHKVSRLITKDWVTSPLRAPFTEYKGEAGAGELEEKARGEGMQKAVGQLFT